MTSWRAVSEGYPPADQWMLIWGPGLGEVSIGLWDPVDAAAQGAGGGGGVMENLRTSQTKKFPITRAEFVAWLRKHPYECFTQDLPCDCALARATNKLVEAGGVEGAIQREDMPKWALEVSDMRPQDYQPESDGATAFFSSREILEEMGER